jgi:hypothetical protein
MLFKSGNKTKFKALALEQATTKGSFSCAIMMIIAACN